MDTEKTTVKQAFLDGKQYAIPSYQRNYVWTREGQWQPLWEDVKALIDRLIKGPDGVRPHFLGTIITKEIGTRGHVNRWWVVDGQQRLTTLQVMMAAATCVFREMSLTRYANMLSRRLANSDDTVSEERPDQDRYKLDPKGRDYNSFTALMDTARIDVHPDLQRTQLTRCFTFFHHTIHTWAVSISADQLANHADAFSRAVLDRLLVVDIRLDQHENPHTIFEALNARGEPLTEWEKTKNYILSLATGPQDPDGDRTYRKHLKRYDSKAYWSETVSVPRFTGKRIDLFLFYFAQIELPPSIRELTGDSKYRTLRRDRLYREFRFVGEHRYRSDYSGDDKELRALLTRFGRYADIFESIDTGVSQKVDENRGFSDYALEVMRRRDVLRLNSLVPVFMEMVAKLGRGKKLDKALRIVDSYLMRRVAVKAQYSGFDDTAFGHVQALRDALDIEIEAVLLSRFYASGGRDRWPADEEILRHFLTGDMYNGISSARKQLLLGAIAHRMHDEYRPKLANRFDLNPVTIEHVAPRSWDTHWQEDLGFGGSEEERWRLRQIVHRIGNLTLVTQATNNRLTNKSWSYKAGLLAGDNLEMTKRLLRDMKGEVWNEAEIDRRSRQLADYVSKIWPHARELANELGIELHTPTQPETPKPPPPGGQLGDLREAFWTHYAYRYPDDGLKAKFRGSNQWIRRGSGNPDISLMLATDRVGIFLTRWKRAKEGKDAWLARKRAVTNRVLGAGRNYWDSHAVDTREPSNWDAMGDWMHERLVKYVEILEAKEEQR